MTFQRIVSRTALGFRATGCSGVGPRSQGQKGLGLSIPASYRPCRWRRMGLCAILGLLIPFSTSLPKHEEVDPTVGMEASFKIVVIAEHMLEDDENGGVERPKL